MKDVNNYLSVLKRSFLENKWSIILLSIISLILFIISCYFQENIYLPGIITNIIGAIIILVFIDAFIKKRDEEKEIENIKNQILRVDKLFSLYIDKYMYYAKCITNPDFQDDISLEENFDFRRLTGIFNPSLIITDDGIKKVAFEYYFESQKNIIMLIKDILVNIDFKGFIIFKNIEELFLGYISYIGNNDLYDGIKRDYQSISRNDVTNEESKLKDFVIKIIEKTEKPEIILPCNVINLYVLLYSQMNFTLRFIKNYKDDILKIKEH